MSICLFWWSPKLLNLSGKMLHDRERWRNSFSPGRTVKWIFLVLVDRSSETDTKNFYKVSWSKSYRTASQRGRHTGFACQHCQHLTSHDMPWHAYLLYSCDENDVGLAADWPLCLSPMDGTWSWWNSRYMVSWYRDGLGFEAYGTIFLGRWTWLYR